MMRARSAMRVVGGDPARRGGRRARAAGADGSAATEPARRRAGSARGDAARDTRPTT